MDEICDYNDRRTPGPEYGPEYENGYPWPEVGDKVWNCCFNCKFSKLYDDSFNTLRLHCKKHEKEMFFNQVCAEWHHD